VFSLHDALVQKTKDNEDGSPGLKDEEILAAPSRVLFQSV
jgi:hypothetical protein